MHEVIVADLMRARPGGVPEALERVINHHTTAEQAGTVFARVQPKLAVFTHIIPVTSTARDIVPLVRRSYSGPVEVGEDLMVIDIGDTVAVRRF